MQSLKQITVFGGTGFLGRHVVQHLASSGFAVRVPTRNLDHALPLKTSSDIGQIVPMLCSLRHDHLIENAIGSSYAVINLVTAMGGDFGMLPSAIHVESCARIARIAKAHGAKKFIQVSALMGADAGTGYARGKVSAEHAVRVFFPKATILRPNIIFGIEDNFFTPLARLAKLAPLPLIAGGRAKFQPIYAGDVAQAITACLQKNSTLGQTLNLGGAQVYTLRQLLQMILHTTKLHRPLIPLPLWGAYLMAWFLQNLPNPPVTCAQIALLKNDHVIGAIGAKTLHDLEITPTALESMLPVMLERFGKHPR